MNIDNEEIKKFTDIASRWWDKDSEFKPLHEINPLRVNYIVEKLGDLTGLKILDVGCGGGILSEALAKTGAIVTGIDMGETSLEIAKLHLYESKLEIDYQKITVEELAQTQAGAYDVVTCLEMLEHVPSPDSIIKACATLVKGSGQVFFSTINRNLKSYAFAIVGAEYILNLLPHGTHDYNKFIKPSEIDKSARNANLQLLDIIGMTYNPFTKVYKMEKDVSVNYLTHYKKL
jgi:2-polyprenyl-6-hydroxyphenyl methylase/3-demethylubiquinone-9 3-methyltransferase